MQKPSGGFILIKYAFLYKFVCDDSYIGETAHTLLVRIKEHHNRACSIICAHINTRDQYKKNAQKFVKENKTAYPDPQKARFTSFKDKFKIIAKAFKTDNDCEKTEAFLIRTKRPKINDQFAHKAFKLF